MKTAQPTSAPVYSPALLAGPLLTSRPGDVTTIWRNGEVWREDPWKRARRLANCEAIREASK